MKNLIESKSSFSSMMIKPTLNENKINHLLNDFKNKNKEIFEELILMEKEDINNHFYHPIWLHVKWHYNCYYFYAEYYFEAWTTSTADPNGPRIPVDLIEIYWRHNNVRGHETKNNADMVAKDDRVYSNGTMCDTDICVSARATHQGTKWSINNPQVCLP